MQRDPLPAQSLAVQYREACQQTDRLFALIRPPYLTARPVAERHRLLFYIGHLEAFDWNLLSQPLLHAAPFNPAFDRLFAFGIDPVGGGLPTDQPEDWPAFDAIYAYRDEVRKRIGKGIADVDSAHSPEVRMRLHVAIEHRQMHAETLAYLIHQMPIDRKQRPDDADLRPPERQCLLSSPMVHVDGGPVTLALAPSLKTGLGATSSAGAVDAPFGWDNEYGGENSKEYSNDGEQGAARRHASDVPSFWIDRHMVSNGDFLAFVDAGGYRNAAFWTDRDWAWRQQGGDALPEHPAFWERGDAPQTWYLRTMFDRRPLPLDWPVYVSHAEASAYSRFVGKRLPTEAEWCRAAQGASAEDALPLTGNFDFRSWDPTPVNAHPDNRSRFGVEGQFGNGWEWTSDAFAPFPGFEPFPFYRGYSADFFDGQHYVMKGGSPRTAARMLRPTFRNWFQPHYPYVYAGLRCVSDEEKHVDSRS